MAHIPIIGISGSINKEEDSQFLVRSYMQALISSGAIPIMLSYDLDDEALESCLDRLDGVMLAGGNDVDPALYGEWPAHALGEINPPRDAFEIRLIRAAVKRKMPVFGICRGIQILNVALGGALWQDLPSQFRAEAGNPPMQHSQPAPTYHLTHEVFVEEGSRLHGIVKDTIFRTNSFHHQAVRVPAPGLRVVAHAADGVIEAVEHEQLPFVMGVQWHPERYYASDAHAKALFDSFVAAAACYRVQNSERQN